MWKACVDLLSDAILFTQNIQHMRRILQNVCIDEVEGPSQPSEASGNTKIAQQTPMSLNYRKISI